MGLSAGGLGALNLAARHPDAFAAVASFSGIARVDPSDPAMVLIVFGQRDASGLPDSAQEQRLHYTGSSDVTVLEIKDTGHLVMFERTAPLFRTKLSEWLHKRGF